MKCTGENPGMDSLRCASASVRVSQRLSKDCNNSPLTSFSTVVLPTSFIIRLLRRIKCLSNEFLYVTYWLFNTAKQFQQIIGTIFYRPESPYPIVYVLV